MGRILVTATISLLALAGVAEAQQPTDWFLIPGGVCQPDHGSRDRLSYSKLGTENASSVEAKVSCPLPTNHFDDMGLVTRVLITGTNPNLPLIECTVTAADLNGNALWQEKADSAALDFVLQLDPPQIGLHDTFWEAACTIPGAAPSRAALTSFWIGFVR